jgi:hypothetical protein
VSIANVSDTLKSSFDKAFLQKRKRRYDNCRLILHALSECDQDGAIHADLLMKIREQHHDYPAGNLTQYLNELQTPERGSLIRKDTVSGRFSFADPVYRVFAQAVFHKSRTIPFEGKITDNELKTLFEALKKAIEG